MTTGGNVSGRLIRTSSTIFPLNVLNTISHAVTNPKGKAKAVAVSAIFSDSQMARISSGVNCMYARTKKRSFQGKAVFTENRFCLIGLQEDMESLHVIVLCSFDGNRHWVNHSWIELLRYGKEKL